jgi:hypothetical protein
MPVGIVKVWPGPVVENVTVQAVTQSLAGGVADAGWDTRPAPTIPIPTAAIELNNFVARRPTKFLFT